ncbi:superfamily I DNA/RNA helicase [Pseudarthrobacter defluvii]|uniref:DNA 3'-5' helicase n=1 Tax=Pseudarthrobacter defluvii TaxID=410837 RepID=A0ABT9UE71_9MICC|nr:UvrD-helicase domain-containing protein [Pseudarthrobacter defluvii]MDQ0117934.1 superfamily I DNA/RNA helicase [Pseudarthrobacter defluvii]
MNEASGNTPGTLAPLISTAGKRRRAPDFLSTKAGRSEFWEIKFRARSDFDALSGERVHWTSFDAYQDYLVTARNTGCNVWLIVYEAPTATSEGRWLRAEVRSLVGPGRVEKRYDKSGSEVSAWIWPAASMEMVSGPVPNLVGYSAAVVPDEGDEEPLTLADLRLSERQRRDNGSDAGKRSRGEAAVVAPADRLLEAEVAAGLQVLSNSLGLPKVPRYSVLCVGLRGTRIDDLLGLLHYGIRVFIVSSHYEVHSLDALEMSAFKESRLLEWSILGDAADLGGPTWVIDGALPSDLREGLDPILELADKQGGFNKGQYEIIHAPSSTNLLVSAGAGTGKTETMTERVMFLLSTHTDVESVSNSNARHPYDLRLSDIAFVTFSREAAREMRDRIGRTLMLRRRLCRFCVLPILGWLTQLSMTEVETIHTYAKHLVQTSAGALGVGPSVRVAQQTMPFREILHERLSPYLFDLVAKYREKIPASYVWEDHIEAIWSALEDNGVELMSIEDPSIRLPVADWGPEGAPDVVGAVADAIRDVIREIAPLFRDYCLENQFLRLGQLVPTALSAMKSRDEPRMNPRFLFVDEFQDTDATQMELILEIQSKLKTTLFVVGDPKQGIYRFRGAEGNAFDQLKLRVHRMDDIEFQDFTLSRNFRSGAELLESLHTPFEKWGSVGLLAYDTSDKLRPKISDCDKSESFDTRDLPWRADPAQLAVDDIAMWKREAPNATIAILCRQNWQAGAVQQQLRDKGLPCELLVGGSFYASPAVRELAVLLEAVAAPSSDAALLQLCETRWASGILRGVPPQGVPAHEWLTELKPPLAWADRLVSLANADAYTRTDLEPLRERVRSLAALLSKMPVMAWIVECARVFSPDTCFSDNEVDASEQRRYARCLDHLITLLDMSFKEGSVSVHRVINWLTLQIATNRTEDEPIEWEDIVGKTTALTVHKAKGLEFDRVLVPYTGVKFGKSSARTRVAVMRNERGTPRVIWKWTPGNGAPEYSNVTSTEQELWETDQDETAREEARLLYVAMTRPKERLLIYRAKTSNAAAKPQTWADLLKM